MSEYRQRLQHRSATRYLDTLPGESALQQAVALIAAGFGYPMVAITILDRHHQHTLAIHGAQQHRTPRRQTLCDRVVSTNSTLVVPDVAPAEASELGERAFVGVPLVGREGIAIGALCLLDTRPRKPPPEQVTQLEAVATVIQEQLETLRRHGPRSLGSIDDATELLDAVDSGQVVAHYQPVVDLATEATTGWEALARWEHPTRGLLPPGEFIPLAEDTEIIIDLDLAVLHHACTDLRTRLAGDPGLHVSVNLSPRHFEHPHCIQRLTTATQDSGVDPRSVIFEITETAVLASYLEDRHFLVDLRERGFGIVLDDFATGFSSVEHLLRLPVDGIKIDRVVTGALDTPTGVVVARSLATMAADLGLHTTIEGVETATQARVAGNLGIDYGQGFYWSAPLPFHKLPHHP